MEFEILLTLSFGLPIIGIAGMTTRTILTLVKRSSNRARGIRLSTKSAFYCLYIMQWILGGLGLLFFYIATHEPAVWIPVPDAGKVVDGWQAMIVGFPYYGINGWFLILPLILVWIGLLRDIRLQIYPFVIQVACALVAMSASDPKHGDYPGYHHWVAAFWLAAAAYAVPASLWARPTPAEENNKR